MNFVRHSQRHSHKTNRQNIWRGQPYSLWYKGLTTMCKTLCTMCKIMREDYWCNKPIWEGISGNGSTSIDIRHFEITDNTAVFFYRSKTVRWYNPQSWPFGLRAVGEQLKAITTLVQVAAATVPQAKKKEEKNQIKKTSPFEMSECKNCRHWSRDWDVTYD